MIKAKNAMNKGFMQGVIVNDIFSPNDKFTSITIRVRENKVLPETGKKNYYYVSFSAYGDMAKDIKENASKNQVVYIEYYLTQNKRRDNDGVLEAVDNRVITFIQYGDYLIYPNRSKVPYYNRGVISGEFVNVKYMPKSDDTAIMTIRTSAEVNGRTVFYYANLVVKQDMIEEIENRCVQGEQTEVEFKTVTANRNNNPRKVVEYVVTNLVM